jgi:hypothetical protein
MGYIKEPCFSSHDPYFICSPYYKGYVVVLSLSLSAQASLHAPPVALVAQLGVVAGVRADCDCFGWRR